MTEADRVMTEPMTEAMTEATKAGYDRSPVSITLVLGVIGGLLLLVVVAATLLYRVTMGPLPTPTKEAPPTPEQTATGPTAPGPSASGPSESGPSEAGPTASRPTAPGPTTPEPTATALAESPPAVAGDQRRLQVAPARDWHALKQAREALLSSYAWVDETQGIARIPIARAMSLYAEQGWQSLAEREALAEARARQRGWEALYARPNDSTPSRSTGDTR